MTDVTDLKNLSLKAREEIAHKVGHILAEDASGSDNKAAFQIAMVLVEDVAISVREALALELKACNFLPKDILRVLATDIQQVSMPFLMASKAIDDAFLEEIVATCEDYAQEAVATRKGLSEAVSFVISDVAAQSAVEILVDNNTADVSMRSADRVVDRFPTDRSLMEKLAQRADFPAVMVERIVFKVAQKYGEYLTEKFDLSTDYASYLVSLANRQVFSRTLEMAPLTEIENYLQQLHGAQALNSDVVLNYLQNGNVRLFSSALAVLLGKPFALIEATVARGDKSKLARLFDAAGFAKPVAGVLLIAYERLLGAR
ncbi:MAG: hypothetical protein COB37_07150 [Kordiimonadales bacterium]|nr:MAG: hypothetical protein COB37_07150 [Kordiimonadales bacterium]